jgi:protein-tyrosine phosphatase
MKILMVCTGNICRSPAAEAVARHYLAEAGIGGVTVDSAGTGDWHEGEQPHEFSRSVGRRRGYTLDHRARMVRRSDFASFDLFVAMDKSHARWLQDRVTASRADAFAPVVYLRSFDPSCGSTTPLDDPYGHPIEVYEKMYDRIEAAMPGLVDFVTHSGGAMG